MGSRRRCCSCDVPPPEVCEGCCSSCIFAHKIEYKKDDGQIVGTFTNHSINDIIILNQGSGVVLDRDQTDPYNIPQSAIIKREYYNIGAFWTFYHPAFMVNFDISFPPCITCAVPPDSGFSGEYPMIGGFDKIHLGYNGAHSINLASKYAAEPAILSDAIGENGYFNAHIRNDNLRIDFPRFNRIFGIDPYECWNGFDCPGDYCGKASMNVYFDHPPLVPNNYNGSPLTFRHGYPCSTRDEDTCCANYWTWTDHICNSHGPNYCLGYNRSRFSPYAPTPWHGSPRNTSNSCNFLGLSKYQRRIIRTYFPWAWQIFSYSFDYLIPFGNPFNDWTQYTNEDGELITKIIKYGAIMPTHKPPHPTGEGEDIFEPTGFVYYPMSPSSKKYWKRPPANAGLVLCSEDAHSNIAPSGQRASSLRQQFLGFAFCEHHYDPLCGRTEVLGNMEMQIPISAQIPRRFTFSCSGIPMFEFDFFEAVKDGILDLAEAEEAIKNMRSFTMWFKNPTNGNTNMTFKDGEIPAINLGLPEVENTPTTQQAEEFQQIMKNLSARSFSGVVIKDWRDEAYDEIIEANTIYRECIRDTYILRNYTDTTRTAEEIKQDAEDYAKTVFDLGTLLGFSSIENMQSNKNTLLPEVFPSQLGPVRKRCRQNNPAFRTEGEAEWAGSTQLVTRNSEFGLNVLTPMNIFPTNENQRRVVVGLDNYYNHLGKQRVDDHNDSTIEIDTPWKYQSLYYADISRPLFGEHGYMPDITNSTQPPQYSVGTQNGNWNTNVYGLRYSEFDVHCDMVNRISHLCYTYFFAQPSGWDFHGWSPLPNGPPELNWWMKRFGRIEDRFEDMVSYLQMIRKHSQLTGCGVFQIGNFDYCWNPSRNNLVPYCQDEP